MLQNIVANIIQQRDPTAIKSIAKEELKKDLNVVVGDDLQQEISPLDDVTIETCDEHYGLQETSAKIGSINIQASSWFGKQHIVKTSDSATGYESLRYDAKTDRGRRTIQRHQFGDVIVQQCYLLPDEKGIQELEQVDAYMLIPYTYKGKKHDAQRYRFKVLLGSSLKVVNWSDSVQLGNFQWGDGPSDMGGAIGDMDGDVPIHMEDYVELAEDVEEYSDISELAYNEAMQPVLLDHLGYELPVEMPAGTPHCPVRDELRRNYQKRGNIDAQVESQAYEERRRADVDRLIDAIFVSTPQIDPLLQLSRGAMMEIMCTPHQKLEWVMETLENGETRQMAKWDLGSASSQESLDVRLLPGKPGERRLAASYSETRSVYGGTEIYNRSRAWLLHGDCTPANQPSLLLDKRGCVDSWLLGKSRLSTSLLTVSPWGSPTCQLSVPDEWIDDLYGGHCTQPVKCPETEKIHASCRRSMRTVYDLETGAEIYRAELIRPHQYVNLCNNDPFFLGEFYRGNEIDGETPSCTRRHTHLTILREPSSDERARNPALLHSAWYLLVNPEERWGGFDNTIKAVLNTETITSAEEVDIKTFDKGLHRIFMLETLASNDGEKKDSQPGPLLCAEIDGWMIDYDGNRIDKYGYRLNDSGQRILLNPERPELGPAKQVRHSALDYERHFTLSTTVPISTSASYAAILDGQEYKQNIEQEEQKDGEVVKSRTITFHVKTRGRPRSSNYDELVCSIDGTDTLKIKYDHAARLTEAMFTQNGQSELTAQIFHDENREISRSPTRTDYRLLRRDLAKNSNVLQKQAHLENILDDHLTYHNEPNFSKLPFIEDDDAEEAAENGEDERDIRREQSLAGVKKSATWRRPTENELLMEEVNASVHETDDLDSSTAALLRRTDMLLKSIRVCNCNLKTLHEIPNSIDAYDIEDRGELDMALMFPLPAEDPEMFMDDDLGEYLIGAGADTVQAHHVDGGFSIRMFGEIDRYVLGGNNEDKQERKETLRRRLLRETNAALRKRRAAERQQRQKERAEARSGRPYATTLSHVTVHDKNSKWAAMGREELLDKVSQASRYALRYYTNLATAFAVNTNGGQNSGVLLNALSVVMSMFTDALRGKVPQVSLFGKIKIASLPFPQKYLNMVPIDLSKIFPNKPMREQKLDKELDGLVVAARNGQLSNPAERLAAAQRLDSLREQEYLEMAALNGRYYRQRPKKWIKMSQSYQILADNYNLFNDDGTAYYRVAEQFSNGIWQQTHVYHDEMAPSKLNSPYMMPYHTAWGICGSAPQASPAIISGVPPMITFGGKGSKPKKGDGSSSSSSSASSGSSPPPQASVNHLNLANGQRVLQANLDANNRLMVKLGPRAKDWSSNMSIYKAAVAKIAGKYVPCLVKLQLEKETKTAIHPQYNKVRVDKATVAWIRPVKVDYQKGRYEFADEMSDLLCAICQDNVPDHNAVMAAGQLHKCEHRLCQTCWMRILAGASANNPGKCPICRAPVIGCERTQLEGGLYQRSSIKEAYSIYFNKGFRYRVGDVIAVGGFNPNLENACSGGMHGFLSMNDEELFTYFGMLLDPEWAPRFAEESARLAPPPEIAQPPSPMQVEGVPSQYNPGPTIAQLPPELEDGPDLNSVSVRAVSHMQEMRDNISQNINRDSVQAQSLATPSHFVLGRLPGVPEGDDGDDEKNNEHDDAAMPSTPSSRSLPHAPGGIRRRYLPPMDYEEEERKEGDMADLQLPPSISSSAAALGAEEDEMNDVAAAIIDSLYDASVTMPVGEYGETYGEEHDEELEQAHVDEVNFAKDTLALISRASAAAGAGYYDDVPEIGPIDQLMLDNPELLDGLDGANNPFKEGLSLQAQEDLMMRISKVVRASGEPEMMELGKQMYLLRMQERFGDLHQIYPELFNRLIEKAPIIRQLQVQATEKKEQVEEEPGVVEI
jgi:hypothetical protein